MSATLAINPKITVEMLMEAIAEDNSTGFCADCGAEQGCCEPDAREYICESCGQPNVYGAEELLIMGVGV